MGFLLSEFESPMIKEWLTSDNSTFNRSVDKKTRTLWLVLSFPNSPGDCEICDWQHFQNFIHKIAAKIPA